MLIGQPLEGIWHTGIVAFGMEYYFDGGIGIIQEQPGCTRFGSPVRLQNMGSTQKTVAAFMEWINEQRRTTFSASDYNVLERNCNHFTEAACRFLLDTSVPADVREMIPTLLRTPLGAMLRPLLEQAAGAMGTATALPTVTTGPPLSTQTGSGLQSSKTSLTEDEAEDWVVVRAMLESNPLLGDGYNEDGVRTTLEGLNVLHKAFQRVIDHPAEAKYRRLSTVSSTYVSFLQPLEEYGVSELLQLAGFRRQPHSSGDGDQWMLSDALGSAAILRFMCHCLEEVMGHVELEAALAESVKTREVSPGRKTPTLMLEAGPGVTFAKTPVSPSYTPLAVGVERGRKLASILVGRDNAPSAGGKAFLNGTGSSVTDAVYCSADGREVGVSPGLCEVLCVRKGQEKCVTWVPAAVAVFYDKPLTSFIFRSWNGLGVCRAPYGQALHPGVLETSGRCCIPFGGRAVDVTMDAAVLCHADLLPPEVRHLLEEVRQGEAVAEELNHAHGIPFHSFASLLAWEAPTSNLLGPPAAIAPRASFVAKGLPGAPTLGAKLLVCHDMAGGYPVCDNPYFACDAGLAKEVEAAYTLQYWPYVTHFVYFSHRCVSVPPRSWVEEGHRGGSTVLGTLLTESVASAEELSALLSHKAIAKKVITQLVALCCFYGFDGYLINIETSLPRDHIHSLQRFVQELRDSIRAANPHGTVVWYDAVTVTGKVAYQNALTGKNKTFADVCDGLMTNYWWGCSQLTSSRDLAGERAHDVYFGVDVFGRGTYGGGGYNTVQAVREATGAGLSVAMFAPGWTLEMQSGGSRDGFLVADTRLWAPCLPFLSPYVVERKVNDLPAWTAYASAVGRVFYVNGAAVVKPASPAQVGYCQRSASHAVMPPVQILEQRDVGERSACLLWSPVSRHTVSAVWRADRVWFGHRSLAFELLPREAATVWAQPVVVAGSLETLAVDVVLDGGGTHQPPSLHLAYGDPDGRVAKGVAVPHTDAVAVAVPGSTGGWRVWRYRLPSSADAVLLSVALLNDTGTVLPCVVGGVGLHVLRDATSRGPLIQATVQPWPVASVRMLPTMRSTEYLLQLEGVQRVLEVAVGSFMTVAVVATIKLKEGQTAPIYLGQHRVSRDTGDVLSILYRSSFQSTCTDVQYYVINNGY